MAHNNSTQRRCFFWARCDDYTQRKFTLQDYMLHDLTLQSMSSRMTIICTVKMSCMEHHLRSAESSSATICSGWSGESPPQAPRYHHLGTCRIPRPTPCLLAHSFLQDSMELAAVSLDLVTHRNQRCTGDSCRA